MNMRKALELLVVAFVVAAAQPAAAIDDGSGAGIGSLGAKLSAPPHKRLGGLVARR
jgi:hypothetical protein